MYRSPYGFGALRLEWGLGAQVSNGGRSPLSHGAPTSVVYFRNGSANLSARPSRPASPDRRDAARLWRCVIHIVAHASQHTPAIWLLYRQDDQSAAVDRARQCRGACAGEIRRASSLVQVAAAGDDVPLVYPETMPVSEAVNRQAEVYLSARSCLLSYPSANSTSVCHVCESLKASARRHRRPGKRSALASSSCWPRTGKVLLQHCPRPIEVTAVSGLTATRPAASISGGRRLVRRSG